MIRLNTFRILYFQTDGAVELTPIIHATADRSLWQRYVHVCARACVRTYMHTYVSMYVCKYLCMYVCIYVCICVCM